MKKLYLVALLCILASLLLIPSKGFASEYYDWSDAPGYGTAHNRGFMGGTWQWLGGIWTWETGPLADDPSDDGVEWKMNGETYYGHNSVIAGETVWFRIFMGEQANNDWTDYLRVWLDWDGNKVFDDDEQIISWDWLEGQGTDGHVLKVFPVTVPLDAANGTTWLRARIACGTAGAYQYAYGNTSQGECEDWAITIEGGKTQVPEPASMLLLLTGLTGIILKKKIN